MTILVLGATSGIGESLARAFAPSCLVILCGRQPGRLADVAAGCVAAGAVAARVVPADLVRGAGRLLEELGGTDVDILINAASATSRLYDGQIDVLQLRGCVEADLVAPLELLHGLRRRQNGRPPRALLISSVLAGLPSPQRQVYGALKRLQEVMLDQTRARWPGLDVRIIRLGAVLETGRASAQSDAFARFARRMMEGTRRQASWGIGGKALTGLYWIHPAAFAAFMALRRRVSGPRRPVVARQ